MNIEDIKKLRDMTGAGMTKSKEALVEASGDIDKAIEILRKHGEASAAKRSDREARCGVIETYVHSGRIGVVVEINCETEFVARTDDFKAFAKDIAMHIAAASPEYLNPDAVPAAVVAKEKEIYAAEMEGQNKPAEIIEKILDGKIAKFYEAVTLTNQQFIKDPEKSIQNLTTELVSKVGENVVIRRFTRMELGVS